MGVPTIYNVPDSFDTYALAQDTGPLRGWRQAIQHSPSERGVATPSEARVLRLVPWSEIDMNRSRFALAIAGVALLLQAACAPQPVPTGQPAAPPSLERAESLADAGEPIAAAQIYLDRAATTTPPTRYDHQLRAAQLLLRGGQLERTAGVLVQLPADALTRSQRWQQRLLVAELELARNRPLDALTRLPPPEPDLPLDQRRRAHRLRAQAYSASGNRLESVRERVQLEPLLANDRAVRDNHEAIWRALSPLSVATLDRLQNATSPGPLAAWLELASIVKRGRMAPAQFEEWVASWQASHPDHPAAPRFLDKLIRQQRELRRPPAAIALLLPLHGELAGAAHAIRDGFLAAHYETGTQQRTVIRIYDTGEPGTNIWQVYDRAVDEGAETIVGPLSKQRVATLARGGELDVPVIALNAVEAAPGKMPENLYQFGLLPEDEARQVAERASIDGLTRGVALVPSGGWGDRILGAFADRFRSLGGELVEFKRYSPSKSDFSAPIQQFLNLDESRSRYRALRRITGKDIEFEPRRRNDVDFIFMAAFPRQARLIAPQLRFHHASDLPVLATSHSYAGTPNPKEDRDMEGVTFCDIPWVLEGTKPEPTLFPLVSRLWPEALERYPRLFALGIDAYHLVPYVGWLKKEPHERYAGQTGDLHLDEQAVVHRTLRWAQFRSGTPQLITEPIASAPEHHAGQ